MNRYSLRGMLGVAFAGYALWVMAGPLLKAGPLGALLLIGLASLLLLGKEAA